MGGWLIQTQTALLALVVQTDLNLGWVKKGLRVEKFSSYQRESQSAAIFVKISSDAVMSQVPAGTRLGALNLTHWSFLTRAVTADPKDPLSSQQKAPCFINASADLPGPAVPATISGAPTLPILRFSTAPTDAPQKLRPQYPRRKLGRYSTPPSPRSKGTGAPSQGRRRPSPADSGPMRRPSGPQEVRSPSPSPGPSARSWSATRTGVHTQTGRQPSSQSLSQATPASMLQSSAGQGWWAAIPPVRGSQP